MLQDWRLGSSALALFASINAQSRAALDTGRPLANAHVVQLFPDGAVLEGRAQACAAQASDATVHFVAHCLYSSPELKYSPGAPLGTICSLNR